MNERLDINPKMAVNMFMNELIDKVYHKTIKSMETLLLEGPPGIKKQSPETFMHQWFQELNTEEKQKVIDVLQKAIELTIFSCLVLIDNKTIGYPLRDRVSDYAIYLQVYEDHKSQAANSPSIAVRLNEFHTIDGELHDKFLLLLKDFIDDTPKSQ